jgi:hypothetical protein
MRRPSPVCAAAFLVNDGARWPATVMRGPAAPGNRGGSDGHEELVGNGAEPALTS